VIPAGGSDRRCRTTARTAPSSSVSEPADSAAYRTQKRRGEGDDPGFGTGHMGKRRRGGGILDLTVPSFVRSVPPTR
jgi:hypothetical protein